MVLTVLPVLSTDWLLNTSSTLFLKNQAGPTSKIPQTNKLTVVKDSARHVIYGSLI